MSQVIDFEDSVERKRRKFAEEVTAHNNNFVCAGTSPSTTIDGKVPQAASKKRINVNKYAVVNLNADSDVVGLFRVLTAAGFMKVALLPDLLAHPDVDLSSIADSLRQILISSSPKGPDNENGCQGSDSFDKTNKDVEVDTLSSTYSSPNILAAINGAVAGLKKTSALDSESLLKQAQPLKPRGEIQHYTKCKICHKEVPSITQLMLKHVHLHSSLKKFECALPHCRFQDDVIHVVKRHMAASHPSAMRVPVNKWSLQWSAELHEQWATLMDICFPSVLGSDVTAPRLLPDKWSSMQINQEDGVFKGDDKGSTGIGYSERLDDVTEPSDDDAPTRVKSEPATIHNCKVCGEAFIIPDYAGGIQKDNPYTAHLSASHLNECIPYRCGDCGYSHRDEWSVIQHVSSFHPLLSDPSSLVLPAPEPQPSLFISKFFPFASGFPPDSGLQRSTGDSSFRSLHWLPEVTTPSSPRSEPKEMPVDRYKWPAQAHPSSHFAHGAAVRWRPSRSTFSLSNKPSADRIECQLCGLFIIETRVSMLEHAKRHEDRPSYRCPHCDYTSHVTSSIRAHMTAHHLLSREPPIDLVDVDMRRSWERLLMDCFPSKGPLLTNWMAGAWPTLNNCRIESLPS